MERWREGRKERVAREKVTRERVVREKVAREKVARERERSEGEGEKQRIGREVIEAREGDKKEEVKGERSGRG